MLSEIMEIHMSRKNTIIREITTDHQFSTICEEAISHGVVDELPFKQVLPASNQLGR
jgi:hypothetical protein